jgi:uncharacterized repeat protein (TIGR01451 family)
MHLILDNSQLRARARSSTTTSRSTRCSAGSVAISKTTPRLEVTRGQLVPYTITVNNVSGSLLSDVSIVDTYPAGFSYVAGSALLDGTAAEPRPPVASFAGTA